MKFSIDCNTLQNSVKRLLSCVSKKPTIPVLGCLKLALVKGNLILQATDLEMSMRETFPLGEFFPASEVNEICVSAKVLNAILSKCPSGFLEICLTGDQLMVSQGSISFCLSTISAMEYPRSPDIPESLIGTVEAHDFSQLLKSVSFASSQDQTRLVLNGVFLHKSQDDMLQAVATDGRRLALNSITADIRADEYGGVLPNKSVAAIQKVLADLPMEAEVSLYANEEKMEVHSGQTTFTTKLAEGVYPDYTKILPDDNAHKLWVPHSCILHAVERGVSIIGDSDSSIKLSAKAGHLLIFSSSNLDKFSEVIDDVSFDEEIKLAINPQFLLDCIRNFHSSGFEMFYNSPNSPLLIKHMHWNYVIMPMRDTGSSDEVEA